MGDIIAGETARRVGIIKVLDRLATAGSVFDVEISAADVRRLAPSVGDQRTEVVGKAALHASLQSVVMGETNAPGIGNVCIHPRHRTKSIYYGSCRPARRGLPGSVRESGVREPSVLASFVRRRHHRAR